MKTPSGVNALPTVDRMRCPWWILPPLLWYGWPLALVPLLSGNPWQALLLVGWKVLARNRTDVIGFVVSALLAETYLLYRRFMRPACKVHEGGASNNEASNDDSELEGARLAQARRRLAKRCIEWHARVVPFLFLLVVVLRETGYLDVVKESTFDECVWARFGDKCGWFEPGCDQRKVETCLDHMSPDLHTRVKHILDQQPNADPVILRKLGLPTESSPRMRFWRIRHLGKACIHCMALYPVWKETSCLDPMARALQTSICFYMLGVMFAIFTRLFLEHSLFSNGGKRYFLLWFLEEVKASMGHVFRGVKERITSMQSHSSGDFSGSSDSRAATSTRGSVKPVASDSGAATSTKESVEDAPLNDNNQNEGENEGVYNNTRFRTARKEQQNTK